MDYRTLNAAEALHMGRICLHDKICFANAQKLVDAAKNRTQNVEKPR